MGGDKSDSNFRTNDAKVLKATYTFGNENKKF